jgi:hypothetical protein
MKISPMPASTAGIPGMDLGNVHIGSTASAEKLAAAKAIAQGLEPEKKEIESDHKPEENKSVRRITMHTNATPLGRSDDQTAVEVMPAATESASPSTTSDIHGQTQGAVESTQPLSPQFAALARQRRALQVKEREIAEREAKLARPPEGDYVAKADLLANPLKIFDMGVTHDQLTEAILSNASGITPEIRALKEEVKRVKEDVNKTLTEREAQAEKQALSAMMQEASALVQQGDIYEMVRETKSLPVVKELIWRTYKQKGEVLDVSEALNLVETDLINETLKMANLKKVQNKLIPQPVQTQPQLLGKQMKTLTNRDNVSIPLDRKARAMAAWHGTLRK